MEQYKFMLSFIRDVNEYSTFGWSRRSWIKKSLSLLFISCLKGMEIKKTGGFGLRINITALFFLAFVVIK